MAFQHVPTFLRSALARNPFYHGDIISPEDVLRLESLYPALFDKPPNPKPESTVGATKKEVTTTGSHLKPNPVPVRKIQAESTAGQKKPGQRFMPKAGAGPARKATEKAKPPMMSKFHRNCLPSEPKDVTTTKKATAYLRNPPRRVMTSSMKLVGNSREKNVEEKRPGQRTKSFSVEDLRTALSKLMDEDPSMQRFKRQMPSPYSEDLVRKFLGRKMREMALFKQLSRQLEEQGGAGDYLKAPSKHGRTQPTSRQQQLGLESTQHNLHELMQQLLKRGKTQQIPTGPGFLRASPPSHSYRRRMRVGVPSVSKCSTSPGKGRLNLTSSEESESEDDSTSSVKVWESQALKYRYHPEEDRNDKRGVYHHIRGNSGRSEKHTSKSESTEYYTSESTESIVKVEEIHSKKKSLDEQPKLSKTQTVVSEAKSSYKSLLEARAVTSKCEEEKGLLRKPKGPFTYTRRVSTRPAASHAEVLEDVNAPTADERKVLEKIAEDLVHKEISKQLSELKAQSLAAVKSDKADKEVDPMSFSSRGDSRFAPTTDLETDTEEKRRSTIDRFADIVLKTPELTPPPCISRVNKDDLKRGESAEISLHTPQLSPSVRKEVVIKEIVQSTQPPADTDCSEMSDFVFSEARTRPSPYKPSSEKQKESIQLKTPVLSESSFKEPESQKSRTSQRLPAGQRNIDKNEGTLSEVSTFQETENDHNKVLQPQPLPQKEESISENNQTPDNQPISKKTEIELSSRKNSREANIQSWNYSLLDSFIEEDLVNTSIDLLSEGEFVGAVARKSPGEVSQDRPRVENIGTSSKASLDLSVTSLTVVTNDEDNGEISLISAGARVRVEESRRTFSLSEYINP